MVALSAYGKESSASISSYEIILGINFGLEDERTVGQRKALNTQQQDRLEQCVRSGTSPAGSR